MSVKKDQETLGFQTEVKQLLHLMVHSLYSNKEIFLRELISNSSDAADKLRFEALKNDGLYENDSELKIRIYFDEKIKTITIVDNGIGMSREEIIENLGTIAKSGTKQFIESLTGEQSTDSRLIGQFGVGFYSCFIISKKVEVITRRAGLSSAEGVRWISDGENDYTIETIDRSSRGTKVVLYLRDDSEEFLNLYRLRNIITKYSDHITLPIIMDKEGEEGKEKGEEVVNKATALWARNRKDIKAEEYNEFYKHISHDFQEPMSYLHNKVEGKLEYTSLLFIPSQAPFDMWNKEQRQGIKLYVRRIFIMDDAEQLIPSWLRFVRGVIDSDDLPLNVSRELLQHNKTIDSINAGCTKKILGLLKSMSEKEPEKYIKFWDIFGKVLKEGVIEGKDYKEELSLLFRFASTYENTNKQRVSLKDYVSRIPKDQKIIYYMIADSYETAKNSPHLEIFNKKNIEVLLLSDPVDEWVVSNIGDFDGKLFQSVNKGELNIDGHNNKKESKDEPQNNEENKKLAERIKAVLKDRVKEVRATSRLTNSPVCLVSEEHDMGRHLEKILKASGQSVPSSMPILEFNPQHPILKRIDKESDEDIFADWSNILFDQAMLSEGGQLDNPAIFVNKLNSLIVSLTND